MATDLKRLKRLTALYNVAVKTFNDAHPKDKPKRLKKLLATQQKLNQFVEKHPELMDLD